MITRVLCVITKIVSAIKWDIDLRNSPFLPVHEGNFDSMITSKRDLKVSLVFFYNTDDEKSQEIYDGVLSVAGKKLFGMVGLFAYRCDMDNSRCKTYQKTNRKPQVYIFPMWPRPESKINAKTLEKILSVVHKLIYTDHIVTINSEIDLRKAIEEKDGIPRILHFSNDGERTAIGNALANEFHKTMKFLHIKENDSKQICSQYTACDTDKFVLIHGVTKEALHYKKADFSMSKENHYTQLLNWIGKHREAFVTGGGYEETDTQRVKPKWMTDDVPELTKQSFNYLCFKDTVYCVIYATEEDSLAPEAQILISKLRYGKLVSKSNLNLKWVWLNTKREESVASSLGLTIKPAFVIYRAKPTSKSLKNRVMKHDTSYENHLDAEYLLSKLESGNGTLRNIPGNLTFSDKTRNEEL